MLFILNLVICFHEAQKVMQQQENIIKGINEYDKPFCSYRLKIFSSVNLEVEIGYILCCLGRSESNFYKNVNLE